MFQSSRHKKIHDYLLDNKKATVNELAEICEVTSMTIRRDLDKMENDGLITRVFGGAVIESNLVTEVSYEEKEKVCMKEKIKIAKEGASLVSDGSIVILDSGTTCMEIAKELVNKNDLKIITTDILIAAYLMIHSNIEVYCTGGKIQSEVGSCIDDNTVKFINEINADVCFLGTSAINDLLSLSTFTMDKVKVKRAILNSSKHKILVTDSSKFNKSSFAKVCNLSDFDLVIANDDIDDKLKLKLEENGVNMKLV